MISYWYPPAPGAAAERIGAFSQYLPQHGWDVHVLTAFDSTTTSPHQSPTIHTVADPLMSKLSLMPDYDPRKKTSFLRGFLREFVFPDRFSRWQRAALVYAARLCRNLSFTAILASFPPASVAQLGLKLHRRTGLPLIVDIRDRWIGPGGYNPKWNWNLRRHHSLEHQVLTESAGIITVSDALADAIAGEHNISRNRIAVIPNGYEPALSNSTAIPHHQKSQPAESVVIAHVGTVIARNRPDVFFQSLTERRDDPSLRRVIFQFVGNLSRDYINELKLSNIVQTTGMLPRRDACEEMFRADALLLLTGDYVGRWGVSAKLFEYIQTGRPILCIEETPGSNDRKLLERFAPDRAFFAPLGNVEELIKSVTELKKYLSTAGQSTTFPDKSFSDFSRTHLAARLAAQLDEFVSANQ